LADPQTYVTPRAILNGNGAREAVEAGWAWPLLGDGLAFAAMEVSVRENGVLSRLGSIVRTAYDRDAAGVPKAMRHAIAAQIRALGAPRAAFAGLSLGQPQLMGVLNVTPDSFSDGGRYADMDAAVAYGLAMVEAGAALIDVGGESTRPGAVPVGEAEEADRVVPVVKALAAKGVCVSIDTRHAAVMADALAAGAKIVNDITALTGDAGARDVAAMSGASVVLMHMQGEPRNMQDNPTYIWAPGDIYDYLEARIAVCVAAGIPKARIAVDPGIGFGKTDAHNIEILDHLGLFHGLGCALAVGVSRKGFIGRVSRGEGAAERLPGSLAAALHGAGQGAQILRVHDVAETRQALAVARRLAMGC
jgi:dihydropteroate synthase